MRKNFVRKFALALAILAPSIVMSSPFDRIRDFCGRTLLGNGGPVASEDNLRDADTRGVLVLAKKEFLAYLRIERTRGVRPPVVMLTTETSLDEAFYSFGFWWMPGNVWHRLMVQENATLALQAQRQQTVAIPDIYEKPENRELVNVPTELPRLREGQYPVDSPAGMMSAAGRMTTQARIDSSSPFLILPETQEPTPVRPPPITSPGESTTPVKPPVISPPNTPTDKPEDDK